MITKNNERFAKSNQMLDSANLFVPVEKGKRKLGKTIKWQNRDKSKTLEIKMFEELDILDQDLFLVILSKIAEFDKGKLLNKNVNKKLIRELVGSKIDMVECHTTLQMELTTYELLKALGKSISKNNYERIQASLARLSSVMLFWDTPNEAFNSFLLAFFIDKKTKKINLAINLLSASVFLKDDINYVRHDLVDRHRLKSPLQKAIHSYLSRLINPGDTKAFKLDTIIKSVYADNNVTYERRRTIKNALVSFFKNSQNFKIETQIGDSLHILRKF